MGAGRWHHVVHCGNRREALLRKDAEGQRSLGPVAELPDPLWMEIPAILLTDHQRGWRCGISVAQWRRAAGHRLTRLAVVDGRYPTLLGPDEAVNGFTRLTPV